MSTFDTCLMAVQSNKRSRFGNRRGASWLGGFLVTCSWRFGAIAERDKRTHKQACLSSCCIVGGGGVRAPSSDRFPERIVLEVKPG